ncbi:MAG: exonuclease domain-containing protein [Pseudomonadota bacterium]
MAGHLRLRMALFFVALAALSIFAVFLGGILGIRQGVELNTLIGPVAVAAFGIIVAAALIALLFDENVARPIDALAAALRARAHGGVTAALDARTAKHLADLAPAAAAVCDRLADLDQAREAHLAAATARLEAEKAQLSAILSEIPMAVMAVDHNHRITLYDRQCVHALGGVAALGLGRSVFRYLDETTLRGEIDRLDHAGETLSNIEVPTADDTAIVRARLRRTRDPEGYVLSMQVEDDVMAERPLVFDFALIDRTRRGVDYDMPLSALPFVVFDTETTGLDPSSDEIVQVGAVRMLNGTLVDGEVFDTLVDPGRPIPASSSRIHGITTAMVAGAPNPDRAVLGFHGFARGETLVAHNAPFDLQFLARHASANGTAFDQPVLDTVLLSAALFGESAEHTLDAIAERLDVAIEGAARHTALGDAVATGKVLLRMLPMLASSGIVTLGDATDAMRRHQRLMPEAASLFRSR